MRHLLIPSATFVAAVALASQAKADDRAIAQQAFQEGRDLMAAGKVAEACPKFAAAADLSQTAGVRLNLADCYAKLGKSASAWAKADEAFALAERTGDSAAAEVARAQMAVLKPSLSYLTIMVARDTAAPGLEVVLDGEKLPAALWGTAMPVDPGEREVAAKAPGHRPWSAKTTIAGAGARVTLAVPSLARGEANASESRGPFAAGTSTSAPTPDRGAPSGGWSRAMAHTLALVSGGLGVVGLGIGTAFAIDASSKQSQYQQHQANGRCVDSQCVTISQDAVTSADASTVGFILGGVLAAAGVALWVTAPSQDANGANRRAMIILPIANGQEVGANVVGRW